MIEYTATEEKGSKVTPKTKKKRIRKKRAERSIMFIYATEDLKKFVTDLAEKHSEKISTIVSAIITGYRYGKKVEISSKVPKYVQMAENWKKRRGTL